jgi:hypothetical protein
MEREHERNGARSSAVKEEGKAEAGGRGDGGRNKEGIVPRKYLYSQGTGGTSRSISGV